MTSLLLFFLVSCDEDIKKTENPAASTTIEVSEAPKDTVLLYQATPEKFYIINKDTNLVEYMVYGGNNGATVLLVLVGFALLFGLFFGFQIGKDSY